MKVLTEGPDLRLWNEFPAKIDCNEQTRGTGFQKEADSGQDPQLKAFAQKYLPKLQQHLQMAQSLAARS
ncbi:MAG: DUF4142 domain-containing protein [Acidobacteriaceae bacterium]|nr:DUF4142 domain-containing protein [Acidobacteriaceae bacterium]